MEKEEKDVKNTGSDKVRGSGEKPKIKPHPKITPTQKSSEGGINEEMKSKFLIRYLIRLRFLSYKISPHLTYIEKLEDYEKELEERKAVKPSDEQKNKLSQEIEQLTTNAENIFFGRGEFSGKPDSERIKAMYELYKEIAKSNHDEQTSLLNSILEYDQHDRLMDIVMGDVSKEENIIHKLKIIIRDLQDKTPKINEEVKNFVEAQSKWRKDKEEEFQKSIGTIRTQMNFASEDNGESEMMSKYNEL
jgi:Myosin-like coiled-coil protein